MKKVLLVTSNTKMLSGWKSMLSKNGYEMDIAISGREAVLRASSGNPSIILLDETETSNQIIIEQLRQSKAAGNIPIKVLDFTEIETPEAALPKIKDSLAEKRILIAEDDRQMAAILKSLLENHNFKVKLTFDGVETLKEIRLWRPHLLVLDIMLPVIDGFHICQNMDEDPAYNPKPRILIISGRESDWDKNLGSVCGAEHYLVKPFDNEYFLEKVQEMLLQ